jgi:hypothetical protein
MACSSAILIDDMINGNVTADGKSFFIGMSPLSTQIGVLNSNIVTIDNNLLTISDTGANMTAIKAQSATALDDIAKIPSGVNNGNLMVLTYPTPLELAVTPNTINSEFPGILGSKTTAGIVKTLYDIIGGTDGNLTFISSKAQLFHDSIGGFTGAIGGVQTTISDFVTQLNNGDKTFGDLLTAVQSPSEMITLGVQVFYGVILGFTILALLGVLLITFCDKFKCRYLMYFACIILFFFGIIGFLLSVVFSIFVPILNIGCDFFSYSLQSASNFDGNFLLLFSQFRRPYYRFRN